MRACVLLGMLGVLGGWAMPICLGHEQPGVSTRDETVPEEERSLSERMADLSPFEKWGYGRGYDPAVVNMRVATNLQMQIEEYDFNDRWLDGPFMTGRWGGVRRALFRKGIEISGGYIGNPFWNPVGGTTEIARWHHYFSGTLNFDFEKMFGLEGANFTVSGRWRGGGIMSDGIGITGLYEPSAYVGSEGWRLTQTYYRQTWLDDRIELRLGRQIACDPFADLPITYVFINDAIDANVVGISENIPFSTGTVTWAAFLRTWPIEDVYVQFGVYNNPPDVGAASNNGVDFSITDQDGTLYMMEAGWDPLHTFGNLPASYLIGGYVLTGPGVEGNYPVGEPIDSRWGIYAAGTQMVFSETDTADQQGLSVFVTANWATPEDNPLTFYLSGGLVYIGAIPGRENDQIGLGFAYTNYSQDYSQNLIQSGAPGQGDQTVIELTYAYGLTPWCVLQPDIQYFFNPAANGTVPDALVVGVQIALSF